jgi:hypothetical protein
VKRLTLSKISGDHASLKEGIGINPFGKLVDKLSDYEDTGLDPSEVEQLKTDKKFWHREAIKMAVELGEIKLSITNMITGYEHKEAKL